MRRKQHFPCNLFCGESCSVVTGRYMWASYIPIQRYFHYFVSIKGEWINKNGYRVSIISKIFQQSTNSHNWPHSQHKTQATDIQQDEINMGINLPYVEGTSEKMWHIPRSHNTRSTVYTENTLHKLLCKLKGRVTTEDKNSIFIKLTAVTAKQYTLVNLNSL